MSPSLTTRPHKKRATIFRVSKDDEAMASNSISPGNLVEVDAVAIENTERVHTQAEEAHSDEQSDLAASNITESIVSLTGPTNHPLTEIHDQHRETSQISSRSISAHSFEELGNITETEYISTQLGGSSDELSANRYPLSGHSDSPSTEYIITELRNLPSIQREERNLPTPVLETEGMEDGLLKELLRDILETLQDSSIAGPTAAKDNRSQFWGKYKRVAEEHDSEFLERYSSDMDIVLIFAGLFSAVSTSFIVAMEPSLLPDPSDTTNALLLQIAQILSNSTTSQVRVTVPVFSGPSQMDVWVQTIAYLSLASSLLAAFGAVLGKQWLGYYKSSRYGRGSIEERGIRRQKKFEGLQTWYFDAVVQSFPLLIQFSLFLFGLALSGHMWSEQRTIAGVIIATTAFGVLFYLLTLFASLLSPACPFQSPLSTIFRALRSYGIKIIQKYRVYKRAKRRGRIRSPHFPLLTRIYYKLYFAVLRPGSIYLSTSRRLIRQKLSAMKAFIYYSFRRLSRTCAKDIEEGSRRSSTDGPIRLSPREDAPAITYLGLADVPLKGIEAPSVVWLLETSTDPEVLLAASRIVPEVEWHPDLDVSAGFIQLSQIFLRSFGQDNSLIPGQHDKAMTYGRALNYLCWEMDEKRIQAINTLINLEHGTYDRGDRFWSDLGWSMDQLGRKHDHFFSIIPKSRVELLQSLPYNDIVSLNREDSRVTTFVSQAPKQDILQVLHLLPYATFGFTYVEHYMQSSLRALVLGVISRILDGQNNLTSESPGVSDCAMVLGRFLGLQFDLKDKRKLDKSLVYKELVCAIYWKITAVFQRSQDITSSSYHEPSEHMERPSDRIAKLEEQIAIDSLPFVSSLLRLVSFFRSYFFLTTDRHLCICKAYFDKLIQEVDQNSSPSLQLGGPSKHLSYLQVSIQEIVNTLDPKYYKHGETDIGWRRSMWNPQNRESLNPSSHHHPWLLDYLQYLCTTFAGDISDLRRALLVAIYSLSDLQNTSAGIQSYLKTITFCMGADKSEELRRTALRAVYAKRDIFVPPVAAECEETLARFSVTLLDIVCSNNAGQNNHTDLAANSWRETENTSDLDYCIYLYVKLIFALVRVDTWHARLIQDGHVEAIVTLLTPHMIQLYPLLAFSRISITLLVGSPSYQPTDTQISFHIGEHVWQSIILDFWTALTHSWRLLPAINGENQWSILMELLPEIFLLISEHATSLDTVESILRTIPHVRTNIQTMLTRKGDSSQVIGPLFDDIQERLERRI